MGAPYGTHTSELVFINSTRVRVQKKCWGQGCYNTVSLLEPTIEVSSDLVELSVAQTPLFPEHR